MISNEKYQKELIRMWDSLRDDKHKGKAMCEGVICKDCRLYDTDCEKQINAFRMIEIIEKWSKEHPPKKYKVSKLEYDIMRAAIDYNYSLEEEAFKDVDILYELLINGYFQGATRDMNINYYFDNCEVIKNEQD